MTHGSLFSGIGGAELAAEWAGWENVFHCEINPFGRKILDYYWPKAKSYADIKQTDFTIWRNRIDVLSGGFPCQPFSTAGKRKGTEDDRHLWPEMLRAIREIQPRYVVGENVRGFTNWQSGLVFDEVLSDLENEGYEVAPFLLPACGVNAPHRRDRIWIVAYAPGIGKRPGQQGERDERRAEQLEVTRAGCDIDNRNEAGSVTHASSDGHKPRGFKKDRCKARESESERHKREWIWDDGRGISQSGDAPDSDSPRFQTERPEQQATRFEQYGELDGHVTYPDSPKLERRPNKRGIRSSGAELHQQPAGFLRPDWQDFPAVSPIRCKYDGISQIMVRNIKSEVYATIRKDYTDKDLQEVWEAFQSEEIQWKIGRLYKIHEPTILLQTVQLCQTPDNAQGKFSPFGEKASQRLMRKLRSLGSFGCSPRGRELEKQFSLEFNDSLPHLSHEIALAAMEIQEESERFATWLRNESIKGFGNAWVPQVAYEIFKVINQMESQINVA
ncbi:DNA-methyltransferase (dcm) [Arachidicoccus rhizosphaerae]|uniref:Cytosine-specific methyltransferase n=1 Tax=Arachidicoccus rhizosphaerae TaxID=551991 RepID=A0A1H3W5Q4_9BACT|nr:DNA (cytosine-5-)-methyltransferase [Arachidicoccus rhizosphaerae]SDZ81754.1 DNA-methyltransferase (dcm) [Arachidicoccus rhizosphaerae]